MKLIADTGIIISTLIKDSLTRQLITNSRLNLLAPAYIFSEINKYKDEICKRAEFSEIEFLTILENIFRYIKISNPLFYSNYLDKAEKIMGDIDIKDVSFIAIALAFNCPIWSNLVK